MPRYAVQVRVTLTDDFEVEAPDIASALERGAIAASGNWTHVLSAHAIEAVPIGDASSDDSTE